MSRSKLIRWSGLAGLVGGLLFAIPIVFHPLEQDATGFLTPLYVPVHVLLIVSIILNLFPLMGLYARQADKAGALGLIGFILAFIIGGVLFGLGMAWLGYALWSENREMAAQARPAA